VQRMQAALPEEQRGIILLKVQRSWCFYCCRSLFRCSLFSLIREQRQQQHHRQESAGIHTGVSRCTRVRLQTAAADSKRMEDSKNEAANRQQKQQHQ
jgi:hypothetical protein